jgi:hypothetical protein
MKKFFFCLLFLGGCLFFLFIGFFSGQLTSLAVDQGIQVETKRLRMTIVFKSEASDVEKSIGASSMSLYAEALSLCLKEPEDLNKVESAGILAEYVAKSAMLNFLRSRIREEKEKIPEEKSSGGEHNL